MWTCVSPAVSMGLRMLGASAADAEKTEAATERKNEDRQGDGRGVGSDDDKNDDDHDDDGVGSDAVATSNMAATGATVP